MSDDEAAKVADVIQHADGGCSSCVGGLTGRLAIAFPDHDWPALLVRVGYREYAPNGDAEAVTLTRLREDVREAREAREYVGPEDDD